MLMYANQAKKEKNRHVVAEISCHDETNQKCRFNFSVCVKTNEIIS